MEGVLAGIGVYFEKNYDFIVLISATGFMDVPGCP